ncbi:unnamed protein product [Mytilus coruscus]|uniref:Uncharacterized protein n=1 Tax=Mytilus coruscus TaxID=42192 RepID=A0A6J8B5L6_MYTCO|nr:unnamed protein product [Mytilus coruscus]
MFNGQGLSNVKLISKGMMEAKQNSTTRKEDIRTEENCSQVKPGIKSELDSLVCDGKGDNSLKVNQEFEQQYSNTDNSPKVNQELKQHYSEEENLDFKQCLQLIDNKDGNKTECLETKENILNCDMCPTNCLTEKSLDKESTVGKENKMAILNLEKNEPELNLTLGGAYKLDASQLIQKLAKEVEKAQNTSNGPIDDINLKTLAHIADALKETRDSERFSKESIPTVVNDIMQSNEMKMPDDKSSKPVRESKLDEVKQETLDMKSKVKFEGTDIDSNVCKQRENNDNVANKEE